VRARIGEIHDSADDGIILLIEHFAGKQPAELRIFLVESAAGHGEHEQKRTRQESGAPER